VKESVFVISQSPPVSEPPGNPAARSTGQCRALEEKLAAELAQSGFDVLLVPHIYYMERSHAAVSRLREIEGKLILAGWLHPRAAYWIAAWLGVRGGPCGTDGADSGSQSAEPEIFALDLDAFESFEELVAECIRLAGTSVEGERSRGRVERISDGVSPRWYPVLDYSRCAGCGQCHDFCLFGVYSIEDGAVSVAWPDNCKPGCPACARVCPRGAIMFPHYAASREIAGAPADGKSQDTRPPSVPGEKGGPSAVIPLPSTAEPCDCECDCDCEERACTECDESTCACTRRDDDLDDLIDALDELDE